MNIRGGCFLWFLLMVVITNTPFFGHKNEYGQNDFDVYDWLITIGLGIFSFWLVHYAGRRNYVNQKLKEEEEEKKRKEKEDREFQQNMGMTREEWNESRKKEKEKRKVEEKKEKEKENAITELKKYKEQLDLELITQEEYDQHKERLGKIIKG